MKQLGLEIHTKEEEWMLQLVGDGLAAVKELCKGPSQRPSRGSCSTSLYPSRGIIEPTLQMLHTPEVAERKEEQKREQRANKSDGGYVGKEMERQGELEAESGDSTQSPLPLCY